VLPVKAGFITLAVSGIFLEQAQRTAAVLPTNDLANIKKKNQVQEKTPKKRCGE